MVSKRSPPFEVHLSDQLPESLERGAHYFWMNGLFFDWSPRNIAPEAKEKSYKVRFFHAMHKGRASFRKPILQLNEWREEY